MAARNLVYSLKRKQESGLREWNRRLAVAFPEVLQPFRCVSHPSRYMVLTIPGVATLRRDPDQRALGDAETADAALAASGDGRAFERLYRAHVARVHSLVRRMTGPDSADILDGVAGRPAAPELSMDFEEAIGRLPDGARQVFVLHDIEGYRHEEIADMLGIVAGTSKSQLHHARMALRRHLER